MDSVKYCVIRTSLMREASNSGSSRSVQEEGEGKEARRQAMAYWVINGGD